jgi:hypothetical protein
MKPEERVQIKGVHPLSKNLCRIHRDANAATDTMSAPLPRRLADLSCVAAFAGPVTPPLKRPANRGPHGARFAGQHVYVVIRTRVVTLVEQVAGVQLYAVMPVPVENRRVRKPV